ncbi:MAG: YitT family protein, partial [Eubacterium sp.]|nr:YitT family protein [Eubacterium sp.]
MEKYINRTVMTDIGFEILGNTLLAAATYNVAAAQGFPLSGFNGIAMVFYRLFQMPIGLTVLVLNIIPALLCMKVI